jgi:hypothetical protein
VRTLSNWLAVCEDDVAATAVFCLTIMKPTAMIFGPEALVIFLIP